MCLKTMSLKNSKEWNFDLSSYLRTFFYFRMTFLGNIPSSTRCFHSLRMSVLQSHASAVIPWDIFAHFLASPGRSSRLHILFSYCLTLLSFSFSCFERISVLFWLKLRERRKDGGGESQTHFLKIWWFYVFAEIIY